MLTCLINQNYNVIVNNKAVAEVMRLLKFQISQALVLRMLNKKK